MHKIFLSFFLSLLLGNFLTGQVTSNVRYAEHSVLATGNWYKVGISETGVQRLTYSDLSSLGMDVEHLNPRNIRVYHNGGGVLNELNADPRIDDLKEIPIVVYGEADGKFDREDYVLFYARGPVVWKYAPNSY